MLSEGGRVFGAFAVDRIETYMIFRLTKLMIIIYVQLGIMETPAIT